MKLPGLSERAVRQAVNLLRHHQIEVFVCNRPQLAAFEPSIGWALDLIAVGGVSNGKEAQVALSRGARAVQVGSALMKEGPAVFVHIQQELSAERSTPEATA